VDSRFTSCPFAFSRNWRVFSTASIVIAAFQWSPYAKGGPITLLAMVPGRKPIYWLPIDNVPACLNTQFKTTQWSVESLPRDSPLRSIALLM
jgi:hypothetical protein